MFLAYVAYVAIGGYSQRRNIEFSGIPAKPVLDIAALVGVINQHIRFGNSVDSLKSPGERRFFFNECPDITRQVRTDIRRIADGIGNRNVVIGYPRGP